MSLETESSQSYPLPKPQTQAETARLDIQHALSLADANGALLLSPFPPPNGTSLHVADIGSGTGSWTLNFAHRYPSTNVVGIDLSLPAIETPANATFVIHDLQKPWPATGALARQFDLIHGRQILLNLPDPVTALRHAFDRLRPGGIIEFREWWCPMGWEGDQDSVPLLVEWHRWTVEAAARIGCDHGFAEKLPGALESVGFVALHVVDSRVELGGWGSGDERNEKTDLLLRELIRVGAPAYAGKMFVGLLGWDVKRAEDYAERVARELERHDLQRDKIFSRFRVVWAKKPDSTWGNAWKDAIMSAFVPTMGLAAQGAAGFLAQTTFCL
ncbi:hypothetical protein OQA88_8904 [Cercophora sp. LCS_1]